MSIKVETYSLKTSEGRPIRKATRVIFESGWIVEFLELLPKREAIKLATQDRDARFLSLRGKVSPLGGRALKAESKWLEFENATCFPHEHYSIEQIADFANIGFTFMAELTKHFPTFEWNESPAEFVRKIKSSMEEEPL